MRTISEKRHTELKYAKWLFTQKHLSELLADGMWPNFKEFTECAAGFHAVMQVIPQLLRSESNIACYCIGDGHRPQMACMISALTRWMNIFSIDPLLCAKKWENKISSKISLCKTTTEKLPNVSLSIVIAIHSHANFNDFWNRIPCPAIGISIPCCVPQTVDNEIPLLEYIDMGITSPMNAVLIWKK